MANKIARSAMIGRIIREVARDLFRHENSVSWDQFRPWLTLFYLREWSLSNCDKTEILDWMSTPQQQAQQTALTKTFRPGQYLFKEGDPSNSMFLVKKGTVAVRKSKPPAFVEIARIYSNEVLGELSFFDRQPRSASAVALTDLEVLEIRFDSLDKIYVNVPDYMKTIMASIADRLRKANDTIRRLQKNLVKESVDGTPIESADPGETDAISAEDVLAATSEVDDGSNEPK